MQNEDEEIEITLRSYSNIWRVEKVLEHLNGLKIPSTHIEYFLYYIGCLAVEGMILFIIPPLREMSVVLIFGIPYGIATFLKKVKLDGKNPIKFFGSLLKYAFSPKSYVRFKPCSIDKSATFDGMLPYRKDYIVYPEQDVKNNYHD